ncbi:hypothetical protein FKM82_028780 [Ascaphus truei]
MFRSRETHECLWTRTMPSQWGLTGTLAENRVRVPLTITERRKRGHLLVNGNGTFWGGGSTCTFYTVKTSTIKRPAESALQDLTVDTY